MRRGAQSARFATHVTRDKKYPNREKENSKGFFSSPFFSFSSSFLLVPSHLGLNLTRCRARLHYSSNDNVVVRYLVVTPVFLFFFFFFSIFKTWDLNFISFRLITIENRMAIFLQGASYKGSSVYSSYFSRLKNIGADKSLDSTPLSSSPFVPGMERCSVKFRDISDQLDNAGQCKVVVSKRGSEKPVKSRPPRTLLYLYGVNRRFSPLRSFLLSLSLFLSIPPPFSRLRCHGFFYACNLSAGLFLFSPNRCVPLPSPSDPLDSAYSHSHHRRGV